jgi:hypothetical protein
MLKRLLHFFFPPLVPGICRACGDRVPDGGTECWDCYEGRQW